MILPLFLHQTDRKKMENIEIYSHMNNFVDFEKAKR